MADLDGFNAHEVEPTASFEAIPAGKYLAAITDSEMKPTKNGSGSYLQLTFTILEGEYKGRVVWARLNLVNPNQTAVKIAQGSTRRHRGRPARWSGVRRRRPQRPQPRLRDGRPASGS
jgi:hypothetical protein